MSQYEADAEYDEQHSEGDCSGDEDFEDYVFFAVVEEPFFGVGHCWEEEVVEEVYVERSAADEAHGAAEAIVAAEVGGVSHEEAEDEGEAGVAEDEVTQENLNDLICIFPEVNLEENKGADEDDCYEGVDIVVAEEAVDLLLILTTEQAEREELAIITEVVNTQHSGKMRCSVSLRPPMVYVAQDPNGEEPDAGIFKEF